MALVAITGALGVLALVHVVFYGSVFQSRHAHQRDLATRALTSYVEGRDELCTAYDLVCALWAPRALETRETALAKEADAAITAMTLAPGRITSDLLYTPHGACPRFLIFRNCAEYPALIAATPHPSGGIAFALDEHRIRRDYLEMQTHMAFFLIAGGIVWHGLGMLLVLCHARFTHRRR